MAEFRRKPGEVAQAAGRRFERYWAAKLGVKAQKGSGGLWWGKLDVADGSITFSCKFTTHRSFSITKELLRECEKGVHENGDNSIPALAIALDDGEDVVVALKAADFLRLLSHESVRYIAPSKGDQKRRISRVPSVLREVSTEDA